MKALSIHETKTHMSKLLRQVDQGEKVVFGARGHAQYQITQIPQKKIDRSKALGVWKGKVKIYGDIVGPDQDLAQEMEEGSL